MEVAGKTASLFESVIIDDIVVDPMRFKRRTTEQPNSS
jgi:hypothetical protein